MADNSNKLFKSHKTKGSITEKELKCFTIEFKLYLLLKFTSVWKMFQVGQLFQTVANLDSQLKPVVQSSWSYIKDLGDFIKKIKNISTISKDSILVTADVVGLYPSIPHDAGLKAQEKALNNRTNKKFSTEDLVKMARFVLKNNYFEFKCNSSLKFTYESSKTSIPFLDLKVSLSNGDLSTDLHIKSTDRHQFLHYIVSS